MPAEVTIADRRNIPEQYKKLAQAVADKLPDDLIVNIERHRQLYTDNYKYTITVSMKYSHEFILDGRSYKSDEQEELAKYMAKSIWERLELSTRALIASAKSKPAQV